MFEWPHRPRYTKTVNGVQARCPFYDIWIAMIYRCYKAKPGMLANNYKNRGIVVCKEWREDFWIFYSWCVANYKENCSIDRIDNNGNYSPENCRFATKSTQQKNQRYTNKKRECVENMKIAAVVSFQRKFGDVKTRKLHVCGACKVRKIATEFNTHPTRPSKLQGYCKDCQKNYREKNASNTRHA